MWLTVETKQIAAVAEALSQMEEVRFVAITTGSCNLVADVYFGAHEKLYNFFMKLHQVSGIVKYESPTVLKLLKAEYTYSLR
ncbi:MAG: Lrp/AsnC ligand binding domain-containing protein [Cyanobacteria bacterium J06635_15]